MEPQTSQTTTSIEKPINRLSRTKLLIIAISSLILLFSAGAVIYQRVGSKTKSSGAIIIPTEKSPNDPYTQLSNLLDLGEIKEQGFTIKNVYRSTGVAVFLEKPYDENQTKFQAWLIDHGFSEIPKDKILYFHVP